MRKLALLVLLLCTSCAQPRWFIDGCAASTTLNRNDHQIEAEALERATNLLPAGTIVLLNHDYDAPIGWVRAAEYRDGKLYVAIEISPLVPRTWKRIKARLFQGLSLGFIPVIWEHDYDIETATDYRRITRLEIVEVSVVTVPADPNGRIREWHLFGVKQ